MKNWKKRENKGKNKMNWMKNLLSYSLLIVSFLLLSPQHAAAKETATLMVIKEDTVARETADSSAKETFSLKKGDTIMVGKQDGDWYLILKEGKQGYVEGSKIEAAPVDEKLVKELDELSAETIKDIDSVNQYREEAARSKIWGIIVVVLIVGIFGVGIYSTLKKKKQEKNEG